MVKAAHVGRPTLDQAAAPIAADGATNRLEWRVMSGRRCHGAARLAGRPALDPPTGARTRGEGERCGSGAKQSTIGGRREPALHAEMARPPAGSIGESPAAAAQPHPRSTPITGAMLSPDGSLLVTVSGLGEKQVAVRDPDGSHETVLINEPASAGPSALGGAVRTWATNDTILIGSYRNDRGTLLVVDRDR
jgi:hypothetical protein